MHIMARIEVKQYVGYCFYCVRLRHRRGEFWAKAQTLYGRCTTIEQGYGYAKRLLGDLDTCYIRDEDAGTKWGVLRKHIKVDGEKHRQEGGTAWNAVPVGVKAQLQSEGAQYKAIFEAINAKRREAQRKAWEAGAEQRERDRREREARRESGRDYTTLIRNLGKAPHLAVLGLPTTETDAAVIKATYRRLAAKHHPDKGGDAVRFVAVRKAYEQLAKAL